MLSGSRGSVRYTPLSELFQTRAYLRVTDSPIPGGKDCGLHEDKAAGGKLSTVNREGRRSHGLPALNRLVKSVPRHGRDSITSWFRR
jgi:hypothetical protein